MKRLNISDELFSRFIDGKTSETEEKQLLKEIAENPEMMEEFIAISKGSRLTDQKPFRNPNFVTAKQNIKNSLSAEKSSNVNPFVNRKRRFRILATAAATIAIVLITSMIYLLMRPVVDQNTFAQDAAMIDSTYTQAEENYIHMAKNEVSDSTALKSISKTSESELNTQNEVGEALSEESYIVQREELYYAAAQETNKLSVVKPNKGDYSILCKNLDRSFLFEWTASNVQKIHFKVVNSQGKTIAEVTDPSVRYYELTYRSIYPESKLNWVLSVTYKDNAQDIQKGKINIDYNVKNE